MAGTKWELSAVTMNWLRLSCSEGICAAQDRLEGHVVRVAQHSTGLDPLRLTVLCINSSTYSGLPVRITTRSRKSKVLRTP